MLHIADIKTCAYAVKYEIDPFVLLYGISHFSVKLIPVFTFGQLNEGNESPYNDYISACLVFPSLLLDTFDQER